MKYSGLILNDMTNCSKLQLNKMIVLDSMFNF